MKSITAPFFLLSLLITLNACTNIQVAPTDKINSDLPSKITLIDEKKIKSSGFTLQDGEITLINKGKKISIPRSDVSRIETIDRAALAKKVAIPVLAVTTVAGVYSLIDLLSVYPEWALAIIPITALTVVGIGGIAGAAGYIVGERTYYNLNPLEINRQTEYTSQLLFSQKSKPKTENWRGLHFGLNIGPANAYFPKISKNINNLGQNKNTWALSYKGELGIWLSQKLLIDGSFSFLNAYEEKGIYGASRDMTLAGLQATYFPKKKGLFYKGGFNFGGYSEFIEDTTTLNSNGIGDILYEKNNTLFAVNASLGHATPIFGHLNLTTELSVQTYVISNNSPASLIAGTVGLHWY